jgi:prepilin-type N-terminal cleavage/methylation domain-containing protein
MRQGFTLIEVVAAVAIATISGAALLQMSANSLNFFTKIHEKSLVSEELSLVGAHADIKFNRTTKSLDDILDRSYNIDNDELRDYLKAQTFDYNEVVLETITLDEDSLGDSEDEESEIAEDIRDTQDPTQSALAPVIQFEIVQVSIKNKKEHGSILQVRELNSATN